MRRLLLLLICAPSLAYAGGTSSGGSGLLGGGGRSAWFKPGPLFWPDGTAAGKLVREASYYADAEKVGNMLCYSVPHVAQKVCHRAADVAK